jgi:acetyl esterase/lipase
MSEYRSVSLKRLFGRNLDLDIFPPTAASLGACVILLHGGGWMFGDRADVHPYARELAGHGFTAIAAEYRLIREAAWPAQVQDVKDAIVWARANAASLGVSPEKIALQGLSAGGHLALLAAATAGRAPNGEATPGEPVGAVVALFAPTELRPPPAEAGTNPVRALLGSEASAAKAAAASPISHVGEGFPPTCLIHGARDALLPHAASLALFSALDVAKAPVELHIYHGQSHEFAALPSLLGPVQAVVAHFLKRTMVDPEFYARENEALNPFAQGRLPPAPAPTGAA